MRRVAGVVVACVAAALVLWWSVELTPEPTASTASTTGSAARALTAPLAAVAADARQERPAAAQAPVSGGAAVAPVVSAREPAGSTTLADPGADDPPPPYPWAETPPSDARRVARRKPVTVVLGGEPLLDVLRALEGLGLPPIQLTPAATEVAREARVRLRLKGIRGYHALMLAVTSAPGLGVSWYPDRALVHLLDEEIPTAPALVPPTADERVQEASESGRHPDPRWRDDAMAGLDLLVSGSFDDTPLEEVLDHLRTVIGAPIVLARSVDDGLTVTLEADRVPARELLGKLLPAGLGWSVRSPGIWIGPPTEAPEDDGRVPVGPALRDHVVDLDLRGVTLRAVGQALERQGVPVIVTREAWESAGTLSLVVRGQPLRVALQAPPAMGRVRIILDPRSDDTTQEVVLISGQLPAVTDELLERPLPRYAGVAEVVARRRATLVAALTRRADLRARTGPLVLISGPRRVQFEPWPLFDLERDVDTQAAELTELLAWVRRLEAAPGRVRDLEQALAAATAARDLAREPHLILLHGQRASSLEWDLRDARADAALLRDIEAGAGPPE